jgi:hypothetical protein
MTIAIHRKNLRWKLEPPKQHGKRGQQNSCWGPTWRIVWDYGADKKCIQHTLYRIRTSTCSSLARNIRLNACEFSKMCTNNHTMENLILDNSTSSIHFVLCESCFWSATILKMGEDSVCSVCADSNVSFIPLSINERSRRSMSAKPRLVRFNE